MHAAGRRSLVHALLVLVPGFAIAGAGQSADPERLLADRFQFSQSDLAQVRSHKPVAKMIAGAARGELAVGGAIRLEGDKNRVADWIRNIEHFRTSAELGVTRVVNEPPAPASFADLTLDATDLAALQKCTSSRCDLRLPVEAIGEFHNKVQWGTATAAVQASALARELLAGYAKAYLRVGDAALGNGFGDLMSRANTFQQLVPEFADYLQRFPAATLAGVDQRLYWSALPMGDASIVSLHHLAIHRRQGGDIVIADKTIYASRYFDAGALVISLQDAADGRGYYLIAGSRVKSADLTGMAASVLRRQIQKSALDTVRMYLGWMRDSLAQPPSK